MRVSLKVADVAKETGALLQNYLEQGGLNIDRLAPITISYGVPHHGLKCLNGRCGGGDKMRRLRQMNDGGCRTVPWFAGTQIPSAFQFPALARRTSGHGGEDIVPVFQSQEIPWRIKAGWSWFSSYIPVKTEYRVWIFRDKHLDTYEKVMHRPEDYIYIGRNFRNGFDFEHISDPPKGAIAEAKRVIQLPL